MSNNLGKRLNPEERESITLPKTADLSNKRVKLLEDNTKSITKEKLLKV